MTNLSLIDLKALINMAIRPIRRRLDNMVLLGEVLLVNDDKTPAVQVSTVNNEVIDGARYVQDYGFNSKPRRGSVAVLAKIQGNPSNVVVLKIGDREFRFTALKDGEVAIADDQGNYIHLQNGGNIDVVAPNNLNLSAKSFNINAETITFNGQTTTINGLVDLAGGGAGLARLGDTVVVDPATHEGTITSASAKATSA